MSVPVLPTVEPDEAGRTTVPRTVPASTAGAPTSLIPDVVLDGIHAAVTAIPGYPLLTQVIGVDPITGHAVTTAPQQLVESVLTGAGPFGAATGRVLAAAGVVDEALAAIHVRLAAHRITLARIGDEIAAAWAELSVTAGIDGNAAMLGRHVGGMVADVRAAVAELIETVLSMVRRVVADLAGPLLQRPGVRPVWELATQVFRYDPLRGAEVRVPTVEILTGFLTVIGREQTIDQLRERGVLQSAADWLDTRLETFAGIRDDAVRLFADAWAALSPESLPRLLDTLPQLAERAITLIRRILSFGADLLGKALALVKDALRGALAQRAARVPGYPLLTVLIEQDPLTGARVPRTTASLIEGFLGLLPGVGAAAAERLAEAGVLTEAAARIEAEVARLGIGADMVTGLFHGIWDSLELADLLDPAGACERVVARFGEPLGRLVAFATVVVEVLITTALKLMDFPPELLTSIVADVAGALADIRRDPVGFLLNVVRALRLGFAAFLDGIAGHLLRGLGSWLLRGLAGLGVAVPDGPMTTSAVLDMAMQVLGISAETLWEKVAVRLGPERTAALRNGTARLGEAWQFVTDLRDQGLSGILAHLADRVGALWDTLIGLATDWIMTQVVQRAAARLLSMLDPTGVMAVVNGCVAFFTAVRSAIEYLRDILRIVEGYTRTMARIARGELTPGAEQVTRGLADAVPVAIGFLAAQVGLGNVPEKLVELIESLRALIDRAITWLFDQAVRLGSGALNALRGEAPGAPAGHEGGTQLAELAFALPFPVGPEEHELIADVDPRRLVVHSTPTTITDLIAANPGTTLQADHDRYVAAVDAFKQALDERARTGSDAAWADAEKTAKKKLAAVKKAMETLVATITPLKGFDPAVPGTSAPGIGTEAYWDGNRPLSLQNGSLTAHRIWHLTAEHVIPFDLGVKLWNAVALGAPERDGGKEVTSQRIIMIYRGAGDLKTTRRDPVTGFTEREISRLFGRAVKEADFPARVRSIGYRDDGPVPGAATQAEQARRELLDAIDRAMCQATQVSVGRTRWAVETEWASRGNGFATTNGQRRGESAPTPTGSQIEATADVQRRDILLLVTHAVEHALEQIERSE
ncbi:hypothetical protein ACWT_2100 [Actinoplanes sp. SE50]|uniref:hypothetical protein n=1 Tax=unclassified Actinoplanes TaxID=2626549 RepID=UPI00023EC779|nr:MULTISPECIES: hypothetical protein [unclassified Actinoplanes]AEV83120.1 hypothetical protein ACPL_2223 [Actinoplanes sp. SE50/110]ATO81515.1 hypothetical protein ACWT_2100 [Actinoplanes sp. SE50]SLL98922.1 hypothetical protein ACSP50_2149 [Actinoplanes sp. SE50/110]